MHVCGHPCPTDDLHRPLNVAPERLKEILCKREQRHVGSQLTLSFERKRVMLEETAVTRGLVGCLCRDLCLRGRSAGCSLEGAFPAL